MERRTAIRRAALAAACGWTLCSPAAAVPAGVDRSVAEFPRVADEADDTPRLQRAIDATPSGVLYVPGGLYLVSSPVVVTNLCSLEMHKGAVLRAVCEMQYVLKVDNSAGFRALPKGDDRQHDYNLFVKGGRIDGNGLAACMALDGFRHYTLRDTTFLNGRTCGLRVNGEAGGYELIAFNLYFKCVIPGLAGNAAVWSTGGDSHYTDCVAVDYTVGFRMGRGGSNRLTRCHVWGGPLPAAEEGGEREMLKGSVNFWIDGASDTILRDCYADTGKTGFLVDGWDTHLDGCRYFNNYHFKLDDITVIDHRSGRLLVNACRFNKSNPRIRAYTGIGTVEWRNMIYAGFPSDAPQPGALDFEADQDCASADDWEILPGGRTCALEAGPNAFAGKPDCRSWRFPVSRKAIARKFPQAGAGKELVVRARATCPDTKAVEVTLIHADGKVWGIQLPLGPEWRDIRVPLPELHYFKHWGGVPPLEPGDAPDARRLQAIGLCYGKWLCQSTLDREHGFEISSVRITGR